MGENSEWQGIDDFWLQSRWIKLSGETDSWSNEEKELVCHHPEDQRKLIVRNLLKNTLYLLLKWCYICCIPLILGLLSCYFLKCYISDKLQDI